METQNDQMATWWMHLTLHHNRLLQFKKADTFALISDWHVSKHLMIMFLCGKKQNSKTVKETVYGIKTSLHNQIWFPRKHSFYSFLFSIIFGLTTPFGFSLKSPQNRWFHHVPSQFSGVKTTQVPDIGAHFTSTGLGDNRCSTRVNGAI